MTERKILERRALHEADRLIAEATAHIAAVRRQLADWEREGRDGTAIHQALEALATRVELVRQHKGIVARQLHKAKRQKDERRAAGTYRPAFVGAGGPKNGL